jgi:hypothetical protein
VVEVGISLAAIDDDGYPDPADEAPLVFELFISAGRLERIQRTGEPGKERPSINPGGFDPCAQSRCQQQWHPAAAKARPVEIDGSSEPMQAGAWRPFGQAVTGRTRLRRYNIAGDQIELELEPDLHASGDCAWR